MFRRPVELLSTLVFPTACRVCGQESGGSDANACDDCWAQTTIFKGNEMLCDKCGAFFDSKAAPRDVFCRQCDDHHYERAFALGIYEKALAAAIIGLKSAPNIPHRVKLMVREAALRGRFDEYEMAVPVPLARRRQIERGYNQADLIAHEVAAAARIRIDNASLVRKAYSPIHRMGMDKRARELSVQNAFEAVRPKLIAGKRILLVDDVFTSGATASFCAKALKKAGAARVSVFTLARAVME